MKCYEAMFLFDTAAMRDWAAIEEEVRRLCGRIGAELLVCLKFDERRLAFEIKRRKRGTYALVYMDAPPERLNEMERDAQLSELILRLLVVRADNLTEEKLAYEIAAAYLTARRDRAVAYAEIARRTADGLPSTGAYERLAAARETISLTTTFMHTLRRY